MAQDKKRLLAYIGVGSVVVLLIGGLMLLIFNAFQSRSENDPNQNSRIDQNSGETVLTPDGKNPEIYGTDTNTPIYLGLARFYDVGMSQDVSNNARNSLNDFAKQEAGKNHKLKQISFTTKSIAHSVEPENSQDIYTAPIIINDTENYFVKIVVNGFTSTTVTVHKDKDSPALFIQTSPLPAY